MHPITGTLCSSPLPCLPVLANIENPAVGCKDTVDRLIEKTAQHKGRPLHNYDFSSPQLSTIIQTPLKRHSSHRHHQSMARWLKVGIGSQLFPCGRPHYPATRILTVSLPRWYWTQINHYCTKQDHFTSCHKKWDLTTSDKCQHDKCQTMFHIVSSCPQTKLEGGLPQIHLADNVAVQSLMSHGL